MNNIEQKLQNEIKSELMLRQISFIVMNKNTQDLLLENIPLTFRPDKIIKYLDYDILISEDVKDNEFKIG